MPQTYPNKKNAPKIAPIGADFQAAVTTNRHLLGTNITPKTRRMHAEKVQFSALWPFLAPYDFFSYFWEFPGIPENFFLNSRFFFRIPEEIPWNPH